MIVTDASAVVELLLCLEESSAVWRRLMGEPHPWHAPHLIDLEVLQALRRLLLRGIISEQRASEAVEDLLELPLLRHSHEPMLEEIWALRHSLTAYDAAYVVLAETLEAPLVTLDARLAASHGHHAKIELIPRA
jgi:predicted nucleic acid-binding protein